MPTNLKPYIGTSRLLFPKRKGVPYHNLLEVRNLNPNSASFDVRARFKRLDGILERELMSDQLSNASEHTGIDETDTYTGT